MSSETLEAEFRRVSLDQQVDDFMRSAKNAHDFRTQRLMVPSVEELEYRAGIRPPTTGTPRPEVVPYQPTTPYRQINQTPTPYQPTSVDRLPRPSGGSLPPTAPTSGAGARTVMTEPPPTAAPRVPTTPTNPTPGARPSNIPIPAGRFSPPVVGAAADIGFRIIAGQPTTQVVVGGAGNLAGGIVGSALGGPVGGMVGGIVGGQLADFIYKQLVPRPAEPQQEIKFTGIPPFSGGQMPNIQYAVQFEATGTQGNKSQDTVSPYGPIEGLIEIQKLEGTTYSKVVYLRARDGGGKPFDFLLIGGSGDKTAWNISVKILNVARADGKLDTGGDPLPSPIPKDTRNPDSIRHPGNQNFTPPNATPAAGRTPAPTNYTPGGERSRTGGTPHGDSPNWVPHGGPAGSPHPVNMPQPLATPLPISTPAPGAKPTEPNEGDRAYPAARPTGSPSPQPNAGNFSSPRSQGGPAILKFPSAAPVTTRPEPTPDALQPTPRPTTPLGIGTGTPTSLPDIQEDLKKKIDDLGLGLVALTTIIKGIQANTTPDAIENAVAPGVCRTTQPGGCTRGLTDDLKNGQNELGKKIDALKPIDALAQAEQLRLLNQLDSKMGPQLTGGLAGKLGRMSKWLQLDRVWNILTYAAVLHNAWMLSSSFGQTLISATSNLLAAIGIDDDEGNPLDIGALIGKKVEETAESIFGKEKVDFWQAQYKKYVRVYQATANLLGSLTSIGYSILSVLEIVGSRISRIGNALRQWGVVGDRAYAAMSENDIFQNPFFNRITRMEEAASNIDTVASEVVSVRQTATDLKTQKKALDDAVKAATNNTTKQETKETDLIKTPNFTESEIL